MKFIDGLQPSIHKWVLMAPDVYMPDFDTFVSKVVASGKFRAAAASVKKQGPAQGALDLTGVRNCTQMRRFKGASTDQASLKWQKQCLILLQEALAFCHGLTGEAF